MSQTAAHCHPFLRDAYSVVVIMNDMKDMFYYMIRDVLHNFNTYKPTSLEATSRPVMHEAFYARMTDDQSMRGIPAQGLTQYG